MQRPSTRNIYRTLTHLPKGDRLFSVGFSRVSPYFKTVKPRFIALRPHYAEVVIRNRPAVRNHIGTVHAIAVCNGLECALGGLAEVTIPEGKRWIPKGMQVEYVARADTDITCIAETRETDWENGSDVPVKVTAKRVDGTVVVTGTIRLHVTDKPIRS